MTLRDTDLVCLFHRVLSWEKQRKVYDSVAARDFDVSGQASPWFKYAQEEARLRGFKCYGSLDGSAFGQLYRAGEVNAVLAALTKKLSQMRKESRCNV